MKLIKILSDKIQIKSDRFEFRDIRINSLIAVSDGDVELVTVVTSLMETDTGDSIGEEDFIFENDGIKVIECSIIGSIRNGIFQKQLTGIQQRIFNREKSLPKNSGRCFQSMKAVDSILETMCSIIVLHLWTGISFSNVIPVLSETPVPENLRQLQKF